MNQRDKTWLHALAEEINRLQRDDRYSGEIEFEAPRELFEVLRVNIGRTNLDVFCGAAPESLLITGASLGGGILRGRFAWRRTPWNQCPSADCPEGARLVDVKGIAVYPPIDFNHLTAIVG